MSGIKSQLFTSVQNVTDVSNTKSSENNKKKAELFPLNNSSDASSSSTGWSKDFNEAIKSWGIRNYVWTPVKNTNDMINKSQNNLIDLIRYFEGDAGRNYKAKMKYADDANKVVTYGYGVTNMPKKIRDKYNVSLPPKSEFEAYRAMLIYIHAVALDDVISVIGQKMYDEAPPSIKEALLDLAFNKGRSAFKVNKSLKKDIEEKNWPKVLNSLVFIEELSSKNTSSDKENAGLYRRSLARVILAAKGLPKSAEIDATVKKIYEDAREFAINAGENTGTINEIDKMYNAYAKGSIDIYQDNNARNKSYRVNQEQMGLFSIAKSIRPDDIQGITDSRGLLKAIMNEIISLNDLQCDGEDENGYPKTALQKQGSILILPDSVQFEGKKIVLKAPNNMEDVSSLYTSASDVDDSVELPDTTTLPTVYIDEKITKTSDNDIDSRKWYQKIGDGIKSAAQKIGNGVKNAANKTGVALRNSWNKFIGLFKSSKKNEFKELTPFQQI